MNASPLTSINETRQESGDTADEKTAGRERTANEESSTELKDDNPNSNQETSATGNQTIKMNDDKNVTINTRETPL